MFNSAINSLILKYKSEELKYSTELELLKNNYMVIPDHYNYVSNLESLFIEISKVKGLIRELESQLDNNTKY